MEEMVTLFLPFYIVTREGVMESYLALKDNVGIIFVSSRK